MGSKAPEPMPAGMTPPRVYPPPPPPVDRQGRVATYHAERANRSVHELLAEAKSKQVPITAEEARALSSQGKNAGADIEEWVKWINSSIRNAAAEGQCTLPNPFSGVRMPCSPRQCEALKRYYEQQGFGWATQNDGTVLIHW